MRVSLPEDMSTLTVQSLNLHGDEETEVMLGTGAVILTELVINKTKHRSTEREREREKVQGCGFSLSNKLVFYSGCTFISACC